MAKTHNKITMERLGQDHLDVHEFHRKGLNIQTNLQGMR